MIANKAVARLTPLSTKMADALKSPFLKQCPAFAAGSLQECQKEARARGKWMVEGVGDGGNAGGMVVRVPRKPFAVSHHRHLHHCGPSIANRPRRC